MKKLITGIFLLLITIAGPAQYAYIVHEPFGNREVFNVTKIDDLRFADTNTIMITTKQTEYLRKSIHLYQFKDSARARKVYDQFVNEGAKWNIIFERIGRD